MNRKFLSSQKNEVITRMIPRVWIYAVYSIVFSGIFVNGAIGHNKSESDEYGVPLVTEEVINLSVKKTWKLWTTEEGIKSFLAPEAKVDLKPGGAYEIYFAPDAPEGSRGVEGTKVLAVQDQKMLSLTWTAPPNFQEIRPFFTTVQIYFTEVATNSTKIKIVHGGWGTGAKWNEAKEHFRERWPEIIKAINEKFPNPQNVNQ